VSGPVSPWRVRPGFFPVLLRYLEHGFAVFGLLVFLYVTAFRVGTVTSGSMAPTLRGTSVRNGDVVVTEKISYRFRRPRRWEVVEFLDDEVGVRVMKRVVGLPGETVALREGSLLIDGRPVARPPSLAALTYHAYGNLMNGAPVACGDGYFILGDDSRDSQDSRFEGPLPPERVLGRSWLVIWPPGHRRFVNP
jgi:signal peptidase I